jgi:hypothetical protein
MACQPGSSRGSAKEVFFWWLRRAVRGGDVSILVLGFSARWRLSANQSRRRPTTSPKQPGFLKLKARGNNAAQRRVTCSSSRITARDGG